MPDDTYNKMSYDKSPDAGGGILLHTMNDIPFMKGFNKKSAKNNYEKFNKILQV